MYYCRNCEETFEEPDVREDRCGMDFPPYLRYEVCPHCHSDDLVFSDIKCETCGISLFSGDKVIKLDKDYFCTNCAEIKEL